MSYDEAAKTPEPVILADVHELYKVVPESPVCLCIADTSLNREKVRAVAMASGRKVTRMVPAPGVIDRIAKFYLSPVQQSKGVKG
jgi:hypothetical protein